MIVQLRIDVGPDDIMAKALKNRSASQTKALKGEGAGRASRQGTKENTRGTIWTIGYEGKRADDFIHELRIRKIAQLIDVRELAFSRKVGFSKSALKAKLESAGIAYCHIPELGSPSEIREEFKSGGSVVTFMDAYRAYLDATPAAYAKLQEALKTERSALMCFEKNYLRCHRKVIAEKLEGDGYTIEHVP